MTKRYDNKIGEKPNNSVVNNRKIINGCIRRDKISQLST